MGQKSPAMPNPADGQFLALRERWWTVTERRAPLTLKRNRRELDLLSTFADDTPLADLDRLTIEWYIYERALASSHNGRWAYGACRSFHGCLTAREAIDENPTGPESATTIARTQRARLSALLCALLSDSLGIELRRIGSGQRFTFTAPGEEVLSRWIESHARVTCQPHHSPWQVESMLIGSLDLPLNLDQNRAHPAHQTVSNARRRARSQARDLPVEFRRVAGCRQRVPINI